MRLSRDLIELTNSINQPISACHHSETKNNNEPIQQIHLSALQASATIP